MRRSSELNKLSAVLAGHDAGAYKLGDSVLQARDALGRLERAEPPMPPADPAGARETLIRDIVEASMSGEAWPTSDVVCIETRALEAREIWLSAHEEALGQAQNRLASAIRNAEVIEAALRPALDEVLAEATKHLDAFEAVADFSDAQLLRAEAKHRNAAIAFDKLAERYGLIRRAQAVLVANHVELDVQDEFAEVLNLEQLYGGMWPGRHQSTYSPFPAGPRQRLAFLVSSGAQPWVGTAEERDEQWMKKYGNRVARPMTPGSADLLGPQPVPPEAYGNHRIAGRL
ncbi:MAG: hypothetical protein QOH56_2836 [Pseudonocardiales bacterium]|jgi:hypothetical protein|nr:hypothetical protein [Pseudonocardiales bacterium]